MSDISKINPNGIEYNLKDATARAGIESSKTLKSSVVTVTDAAPINAEDITVDITPQQDLHGYDRPWAGGAWKNKLPIVLADVKALNTSGTWNGNTYTKNGISYECEANQDGYLTRVTANGTATAEVALKLLQSSIDYPSGCIANGLTGGSSSTYLIEFVPSSYSGRTYLTNGDTVLSKTNVFIIEFTVRSGVTLNNVVAQPMIRLATETDATFAPYSNICPIEGRTGAELDRVGKNLAKEILNGYVDSTARKFYTEAGETILFYALKGQNYKLSSDKTINRGAVALINTTSVYNNMPVDDLIYIGNYVTSWTATWSGWSLWYITNETWSESETNTQLELGTQPTAYEPYQGQQYTASFGETVHGGKWHVTKGGTDKTYGYVDLGDLTWTYFAGTGHKYFTANLSPLPKRATSGNSKANLLCSHYKNDTGNNVYNNVTDGIIAIPADNDIVMVFDSRYTDATAFKTAVTGVQFVYELATPTTISTPKQNVPMLKGINTVSADCGDTSLKYQPDNVVGELKGEIRAVEAEANLEIVYEDHVANTSMGIIVDGYSVGDMPFSNALDIAKTGYTPIAVTDTSIVHSTVANQGEIATHCLLDVTNNRVRFYVHVMDSAASLTIPPNSLTFRVAYKKA